MYTEWASLSTVISENINGLKSQSVLNKFSIPAGKDVAVTVIKQLSSNLGIAQQSSEKSLLTTDEEVKWCMEVISYGLSLPLTEHETIKDCVNVYCEWLSALLPTPKLSVPNPICEDPNTYGRKIINTMINLFVPRNSSGADTINRQAVLCHRVLRTIQHTTTNSQILTRETWESLLLFLLAINDILLAPPTVKDDAGDQLCERTLSVLFEIWLLACVRCFPSPSLWKTFQESCETWRHRIALIEQWNRVNLALTGRLLEFTYGNAFPEMKILEEDQLIPQGMTNDCIAQSWYRFLKIIGSPTSLCCPQMISNTPHFMQFCLTREIGMEPWNHPCLVLLPQIFLKAMKGIASMVDAFHGTYHWIITDEGKEETTTSGTVVSTKQTVGENKTNLSFRSNDLTSNSGIGSTNSILVSTNEEISSTPPLQRRLAKSFSVAPSNTQAKGFTTKTSLIGLTSSRLPNTTTTTNSGPSSSSSLTSMLSIGQDTRLPLAPSRPKCNSILHLFGEWLFEAALIGGESWKENSKKEATEASRRPSSMIMDNRKGSLSQPSSLSEPDLPAALTIDKYESGRAEAIGALCRIFCAKKSGEEILPVYLARFYMALQQGLKISENKDCEETLASILYNSADLFKLDLDGIQILLPAFISALELILPEKELKMKSQFCTLSKTELRRASIQILLSILVLPLHYQSLPIRDFNGGQSEKIITFVQLKPRLINILINALQVETDGQNTHMLLGGLLLSVQDSTIYEENENTGGYSQTSPQNSDTNLLSSACSEKSACSVASANSSVGGSTATMGNDLSSLTISEDFPVDIEMTSVNDSAHALFVRATYLVCHRLISSWKTDLNVSLAALELLSGLAQMRVRDSDVLECKRAVKWICDYICYQCSRPPPAHSKDLHSTIVSAFQCISAWLNQHPYLLQDKDCLTVVLEVVELGISGSKSIGKPGEASKLKDQKELKPVSARCKDAAENLLTQIMEQVGYFPSVTGKQSLSSLLDEVALVKHCNLWPEGNETRIPINQETAVQKFRYFVTENSTIMALLEEPLGNEQDPQPTVTTLIRGPFGRHAWTMQLRHLPRSKCGTKYHAPNPGRPIPMNEMPIRHDIEQKYFPEGVDRIQFCCADNSIPTLDAITQKIGNVSTQQLFQLLESQTVYEKLAWAETESSINSLGHAQESIPPQVCHEFQASRLFLSHFGFLSMKNNSNNTEAPAALLTGLDMTKNGFSHDLLSLDIMSSRTCDTVHIFYVKVGQSMETDIIGNTSEENVNSLDSNFWNMLNSLGWSVDVKEHAGWSGLVSRNINNTSETEFEYEKQFNGDKKIIYWADVGAEIAFVLPTFWNRIENDNTDGSCISVTDSLKTDNHWYERSVSEAPAKSDTASKMLVGQKTRCLSLDFDRSQVPRQNDPVAPKRTKSTTSKPFLSNQAGSKVLLVWLESYEDYLTFPIDDLIKYTKTGEELNNTNPRSNDFHIIFLHSLNSGLLRVKLQGPTGRMNFATPLVDGMVINKRVVGNLVRQTAYNIARRRRLENDSYQPPYVRRRLKIQDMMQKYKLDLKEPELLAHLFKTF